MMEGNNGKSSAGLTGHTIQSESPMASGATQGESLTSIVGEERPNTFNAEHTMQYLQFDLTGA